MLLVSMNPFKILLIEVASILLLRKVLNIWKIFQEATLVEFMFYKEDLRWMAVNLPKLRLDGGNAKTEAWKQNLFPDNLMRHGIKASS